MQTQFHTSITQINRHFTALRSRARWPQGWGRGRKLLAALALALGLGAPAFALVQGSFSDVPPSAFYYNAVEAIYRAGITSGCATGLYCPDQAVTRGQMAVFMQRGFGRAYYNRERDLQLDDTNGTIGPAAQVIIDTTDFAPGRKVFVKVDATVTANLSEAPGYAPYDPCIILYHLTAGNVAVGANEGFSLSLGHRIGNGAVTWLVEVPTGARTPLGLMVTFSGPPSRSEKIYVNTALTAVTAPFGVIPPALASAAPDSPSAPAQAEPSGQQPE